MDVKEAFTKKGLGGINIKWIDDTSLLATIFDKEKTALVLDAFKDDADLHVEPYTAYQARQPPTPAASATPSAVPATPIPQTPQTPQTPLSLADSPSPAPKRQRTE